MVTIYVLIDPWNNRPFYVGSTNRPLKERLKAHCNGLGTCHNMDEALRRKSMLLSAIIESPYKPKIQALFVCEESRATFCEALAYEILNDNGYVLYQTASRFQRYAAKYNKQFANK